MKQLLIISVFLFFSSLGTVGKENTDTIGQPVPTFSGKKNELGLSSGAGIDRGHFFIGFQYKHWIKPGVGLRISTGYNPYDFGLNKWVLESVNIDTVRIRYGNRHAEMFFFGAGIEVQRQFYKKVYLFASLDVLGGYGKGKEELYTGLISVTNMNRYLDNSLLDLQEQKYQRGYIRLLPSVGGKIVFNRMNFGLEISGLNLSYQYDKIEQKMPFSILEVDLFHYTSYRFFIHYLF